jgi:hypothetical protein
VIKEGARLADEWVMIKLTPYKPKISRDSSFAIGVSDLAFALSGVPQDNLLQLSFGRASPMQDNKLVVMRTGYHHLPDHEIGPGWGVWVMAVPRAMKAKIRSALIEDAIPRLLKPWLITRANLTGRIGEDVLDLMYAPTDGTITAQSGPKRRGMEPALIRKQREKRS